MNQTINNRYFLEKLLGEGSFGSVYLATHIFLKTQVVVKISRLKTDAESRSLFEREAVVSAKLKHPNIELLYDFGVTEDERAYLVKEYVQGKTLHRVLDERRLSVSEALTIAAAVAEGLSVAHRENIIHRDLKPSNIIVLDSLPLNAKILDFGVSGSLFERHGEATTMAGEFFGTPKYMSPEQLKAERQTTATDIYGLGLVLYEMIYGKSASEGKTMIDLIKERINNEIVFPPQSDVSPAVENFLRRCLKSDRIERIQTADEVVREIEILQKGLQQPPHTITLSIHPVENETVAFEIPPTPTNQQTVQNYSIPQQSFNQPTAQSYSPPFGLPESSAKSSKPLPVWIISVVGFFLVAPIILWLIVKIFIWSPGITIGILCVICGIAAGFGIRKWINVRRTEIEKDAQDLLFGSKSREMLTQSLALQVDMFITKVNRIDDKILAMSLAIMVREYEEAKEAPHRYSALMNVVQLLEKLVTRLSPWYIRQEKYVAITVSLIGIISGVTTITVTIINTAKAK